jgi:quinol monooxygenase YgiN
VRSLLFGKVFFDNDGRVIFERNQQQRNMKQLFACAIFITVMFTSKTNAQPNLKVMENNKYSVELIRYDIPKDQWAQFEKAYESAAKLLIKNKYCLYCTINKGSEEPNHYVVIIHWTSEGDHVNGFRRSPDFMPFFNLVKPFYNQIQEMKHYQEINAWPGSKENE